jgi:hypothetical protein
MQEQFEDQVAIRTAAERTPPPELQFKGVPRPPRRSAAFVLGYRQFTITDRLAREQHWHFGTIDVSPLRRFARMTLSTEIGVESGEAARGGDLADVMIQQKLGLGAQVPGFVTPFIEVIGGVGAARVELFERNDLVFTWSVGVDAGAQWAVTRWLYLHAAVGWIRPTLQWPGLTAYYDRATFKVGVGF